jgi:hypothetical protein
MSLAPTTGHARASSSTSLKGFNLLFLRLLLTPALAILSQSPGAIAAIHLSVGTPYTQDFDSMGPNALAILPPDFRVDKQLAVRTVGTFASAGAATERVGGANLSSSAANGIYNYGAGATSTGGTNRAVGFLSSGSGTFSGNVYAEFYNGTGGDLLGLQISYDVEKYRNGLNPAGFIFQFY